MSEFKFKFGKKPPKNSPALMLSDFLKAVPEHPIIDSNFSDYQLSNWQMLGNDAYGDCVAVSWANLRRLYNKALEGHDIYPTEEQVYEIYRTQNPNFVPNPNNPVQDEGMDIQTLLEYLHANAGPDGHKLVAFAKVDTTNLEEVKAALHIFGGILLGFNVQSKSIPVDFDNHKPWLWRSTDYNVGGHCVLAGGYLGQTKNDTRFVTWAEETGMSDSYWLHQVDEAWICIWPEIMGTKQFVDGIDLPKLAEYYQALTHSPLPIPEPTPVPTPEPEPVPEPTPIPEPPENFWEELISLLKELIALLQKLLNG